MIILVFATEIEARPFIDYHGLKRQDGYDLYELYEGGGISLVITGMGSMKGAFSLSDFIRVKKDKKSSITRIINYGIAGSLSEEFPIGAVVEIDKVIKYDSVEFSKDKRGRHFSSSFPDIILNERETAPNILATSDHPIFLKEDSERVAKYANFVDMEGYGYAFICTQYGIPISLFKGISDFTFKHSEDSFKQNVQLALENLLSLHREHELFAPDA